MTRHLTIVGPTGSGKSALALAVARCSDDVEIVSLDSMQVYREMDIGTAKPSAEEMDAVAHHLVDVADPGEEWSVVRTQHLARDAIAAIEARGRRALLVGGTGLYVRAVVDGLSIPGGDPAVRARLDEATVDPEQLATAYERLRALDPAAAARAEPGNRRRIVRALEVIEVTGRPFSSFGAGFETYGVPALDVALVGVWVPRAELACRIRDRFAHMRERGLIDEVRALATRGRGMSRTAGQAIGYKEVLAHLDGTIERLDDALDLAIRRTTAFARRQRMWLRRDPRIVWIAGRGKPEASERALLATWSASCPVSSVRG